MTVHLHKESEEIRIKIGVRRGEVYPYLIQAVHGESIRLNWENKDVKIDALLLTYSYAQKHHNNYNNYATIR